MIMRYGCLYLARGDPRLPQAAGDRREPDTSSHIALSCGFRFITYFFSQIRYIFAKNTQILLKNGTFLLKKAAFLVAKENLWLLW